MKLSLLVFQATKVGLQTYESHASLQSYTPPHVCVMCVVCWVGPKLYVKTKCFVSYSFDVVSETHESKEGHL